MLLKKEGNMTVQPTSSGVSRRCPIFSYTLGGFFSFLTFVLVSLPLAFFFAAAFFGAAFLAGACVLQKWGGKQCECGNDKVQARHAVQRERRGKPTYLFLRRGLLWSAKEGQWEEQGEGGLEVRQDIEKWYKQNTHDGRENASLKLDMQTHTLVFFKSVRGTSSSLSASTSAFLLAMVRIWSSARKTAVENKQGLWVRKCGCVDKQTNSTLCLFFKGKRLLKLGKMPFSKGPHLHEGDLWLPGRMRCYWSRYTH